jgi:capsular polysaccharide biosynthesis protein
LELTEAFQRIIWRHLVLIGCLVALGVTIPFWSHVGDTAKYVARTRVVLETADLRNAEEAAAVADAARGMVTTERLVTNALQEAHAARGAADFANRNVKVRAVGASGVLELSVTDRNPKVAAAVANSLARQLIQSRNHSSAAGVPELVAALDREIAAITQTIAELEVATATVDPSSPLASSLRLQHDRAVRERSDIGLQRQQLLQNRAVQPSSSIIDPAEPPADRMPSGRLPDMVIGGLLGLVLGVTGAAALEVLKPTLVGPEAISKALGAPVLGCLPRPPEKVPASAEHVIPAAVYSDIREITDHLNLAVAAAGVNVIRLESAGPAIDLERLQSWLRVGSLPLLGVAPKFQEGLGAADPEPSMDADPFVVGVVLALPTTLRRQELNPLGHLLAMTHWPLIGIITYRRARVGAEALSVIGRSMAPADAPAPTAVPVPERT